MYYKPIKFLHNGEELERWELMQIVHNLYVSKHARERIYERNMTINSLKSIIYDPYLAYYNTDGTINIAKDEYHYMVVIWDERFKHYIVITYKEPSYNANKISYKRKLAQRGIDR